MPYPEPNNPRDRVNICLGILSLLILSLAGCGVSGTHVATPTVTLSLSPTFVSLSAGGTQQFTATVSGATNTAVTWSASGGSISSSGLYTAPSTTGTYTVKATSVADSTASASAQATVSSPITVSISPKSAAMPINGTQQFTATVSGTTNTAVTWSASGGSISSSGLYTAPSTAGTYSVKDTSVADTTKSANAVVTVTAPTVAISISPTASSLQAGQSQQFKATVTGTTNTSVNWLVDGVIGGSSTSGIVSSTGLYTAPTTVTSNQTVIVTAISAADPNQSASASVTVAPLSSQVSVSISPTSVNVQTGQATQFTASVTGTTNTNVTWLVNGVSGGSTTIGTISSTGLYTAPSSVPSANPVTVTAQSVYDPTKSGNATVTIAAVTACVATCYYVSPTGSDSNFGTSAAPFRTIQHAADIVNAGETVIVEDGTYNGGCTALSQTVMVNRGGISGSFVTFKSANKYGAKLDGSNICRDGWVIGNGVSYVRIQDFEITGYAASGGTWADGLQLDCGTCSNIDIVGNKIHDIGKICTDTANGQNGIFMNADNITVDQNSIYNIGRFAPGENGCNPATSYYQNHDHGIYDYSSDQAKIQSNLFYNNVHGWSNQVYPGASTNLLIVNNTFSDPNPYKQGHIICWGTGSMSGNISNNIFYKPNTAAIWDEYCAGITVNFNLSTNADKYDQCGSSCASYANDLLNQNPTTIMVSPDTDFHLILGSPAIGAGTSTNAPATDFNKSPRKNPPSIGAYELGSTP